MWTNKCSFPELHSSIKYNIRVFQHVILVVLLCWQRIFSVHLTFFLCDGTIFFSYGHSPNFRAHYFCSLIVSMLGLLILYSSCYDNGVTFQVLLVNSLFPCLSFWWALCSFLSFWHVPVTYPSHLNDLWMMEPRHYIWENLKEQSSFRQGHSCCKEVSLNLTPT